MKYTKLFLLVLAFATLVVTRSANASVEIVNLSTQTTGASPFVLTLGPSNTVVTVGYNCTCMTIHNVSNKSAPVNIFSTSTTAQPGAIVSSGNYVYTGTYLGVLQTWDLSSTTRPVITNTYNFGGAYGISKMRIVNGFLYLTTWQGGFVGPGGIAIFDLATPSVPSLVSNTSFSANTSGAGDILPLGNYAYVADYFGKTIKIYDITTKSAPVLKTSFAARSENTLSYKQNQFEPWRLLNKGNTLYVFDDDIIESYDLTASSTNPAYSTSTVAGHDVEGVDIRGDLLYYSSSGVDTPVTNKKIQIFNVKNSLTPVEVGSKINGLNNYWLVLDSVGNYYTTMASDNQIGIYSAIEPPTIATSSPTNVASTTITLNASITSTNNASSTDRGFNYGATSGYGSVASTTGTFNSGAFSQNLSSLTCNTLYHYQAFAVNTAGTATSSDLTFTTSSCGVVVTVPVVATSTPTSVSTTTVTLNGSITSDGNASSTDRGFNYGLTSGYGSTASTTGTFGVGAFSNNLTGLTCSSLYHYRSYAINSAGTGTTTDSTFTTDTCPGSPAPALDAPVVRATPSTSESRRIQNLIAQGNTQAAQQLQQAGMTTPVTITAGTFVRSLTSGSSGNDVRTLQTYLNSKGFVIASAGAGSPGHETNYFGGLTQQALAKFQKANNISPAVGYFGPITKTFIQNHQ